MNLPLDEILRNPEMWLLGEAEGDHLSAGALFEELEKDGGLVEAQSRVLVPKKGKLFEDDGSMKIAIIRPCVSRGKRLGPQKLPPIYEPKMLEANAKVFSGWPMYMDHLIAEALAEMTEALKEASEGTDLIGWLEERSRSIRELGGRILESWWDPELVFEDDEEFGFRKGGVVGRCIPQKEPRQMLEEDPGILQTSINAWPTGARAATASWDSATRGMAVEGIRRRPAGSVDWVFRAGAGGRPLLEEDDDFRGRAVSLLEGVYSAAKSKDDPPKRTPGKMKKKLSEMNAEELREHLKDNGAEHLIEALAEKDGDDGNDKKTGKDGDAVTRDDVKSIVKEALGEVSESLTEKLEESGESVEERAKELLEERDEARILERKAEQLLAEATRNGFSKTAADDIRLRYTITPGSGIPAALKVAEEELKIEEADGDDGKTKSVTLTAPEVVERRVRADIDHVIGVMRESGANPQVKGFGPARKDPGSEGGKGSRPRQSAFRQFLAERGDLPKEADKHGEAIREMVREGAGY
ncbi:MAG: hypothetical protein ACRDPE_15210 [Solirubrobacterales bacterium]